MINPNTNLKEVRADARGRVTLGPDAINKKYRIEPGEHGEITLIPIVSIPERERWLWDNPEAMASVRRGMEDVKAGRVSRGRSFAEYATQDE